VTRRALTATLAAALLALGLPVYSGAQSGDPRTKDFEFESSGKAITPQATGDPEDPTTYEDFPFTIAPDDTNGSVNVHIEWTNPADDWDLYVYRKQGSTLQTVGQSISGAPGNEENAVVDGQGVPVKPGSYVIRVVNYASVLADFTGTVRFGEYIPPNERPVAKLQAPKRVQQGKKVKLDASASYDPDGTIKSYAFDLDGNGGMEVKNGNRPVLRRKLKPGTHHVAVRVTDNEGRRAYATRTVVVKKKK
jgi:PKD domain